MTHSYKKTAAALIALALIAAVVVGIVLTNNTSPMVSPSGEASSSSLATVGAQIASDVNIGAVDQVLNPEDEDGKEAVRNKWNKPGATVTPISTEGELKTFLGAGKNDDSTNANEIGVLTKDITLNIARLDDIGSSTFNGILDGNGHTITIKYTAGNLTLDRRVFLNANDDGIKDNLSGGHHSDTPDLNGIWSTGLLTGANRGTIANLVINYESNMAMPTVANGDTVTGGNSLTSGDEPQYISAYGIVTGANFGTIDNVRINVKNDFVGRQQGSAVNAKDDIINRNSRSWENTAIAGTLAGILVSGTVKNTHVDLGDGVTVGAFADGRKSASTLTAWRNGVAISGGMVGFFIGGDGSLQSSYLSGTGTVAAIVGRGDNNGAGKGYNAFSGGITGGKFKYSDGQSDTGDMIDSSSASVGDINAQIRGIVVSWTGTKRDNNNDNDEQRYDGGTSPKPYDPTQHDHLEPGTLIDTANHQSTLSVALTYDYDSLFVGLGDGYKKKGISNTGNVKDWIEVYSTGGDEDNRLEVKVVNGGFRVQAATVDFEATEGYQPVESYPDSGSYQNLPAGYSGEFIWEVKQGKATEESTAQEMTLRDHTDEIGAMVYFISFGSTPASYDFVVGKMATYGVSYNESGRNFTAMRYDGEPVNEPILSLTAAGETIAVQPGKYSWVYELEGTEIPYEDTMFPGVYTFRPRYQVVDKEGEVTASYAYLDEVNRVVVREEQGSSLEFSVLAAVFDVTSTASNGAWTKIATFNGTLDATSYAMYGQTAPSGSGLFEYYTYSANNTMSDYAQMDGTSFRFVDETTTAAAGRTYNNFTVYRLNSAGEYVAVGSARANLTVRIDNAAPELQNVKYYTYSGDKSTINDATIAEHYFKIKEGDPAYTDVTDEIGGGGWTKDELFVVITATDESRSGISATGGAGIQIELQTGTGTSVSSLSPQAQINYGMNEGEDSDLGSGNAAAIGYLNRSYTLRALLVDRLGNSNNSEDVLGTLNVDTQPLVLEEVSTPDYYFWNVALTEPLIFNVKAEYGASGAELQYLLVDRDEMEALGMTSSDEVPEGYEDEWVSLGAVEQKDYKILESFAEGAALYVKLVSSQGLYEDQVKRVYPDSGKGDEELETGRYPYFYVDLVTTTVYLTDDAILIDGFALSEIEDKNAAFAKQYDGSSALLALSDESLIGDDESYAYYRNAEGKIVERATGRIFKLVTIDWEKTSAYQIVASGMTGEEAKQAINANGYNATGVYSQYENIAGTQLTWSIDVGNAIGSGYMFRIVFGTRDYYETEKTVETAIDYRDYNIGIEGLVKYDPDFADYLVKGDDGAATDEVKVKYWGSNPSPFPLDFHYPTGFGDDLYFRYALVGGENGVFNAGGDYLISVDAVQIVPEGEEPSADGWNEFELGGDGSGDLERYDNYNFHFTSKMKLSVERVGVNATTRLYRRVGDNLESETLSSQIAYDGNAHIIEATYKDIYGGDTKATVKIYTNSDHTGEVPSMQSSGRYYIVIAPADEVNYYIANGTEQQFEIISTTIDINDNDQFIEYQNGQPIAVDVVNGADTPLEEIMGPNDEYEVEYFQNGESVTPENVKNVGVYEVQISFFAGAGSPYVDNNVKFNLNVTKAQPRVVGAENYSISYNGDPNVFVSDSVKVVSDNKDGSEFTIQGASVYLQYYDSEKGEWAFVDEAAKSGYFKNVGEYTYRYVYNGDDNYESAVSENLTLEIVKANYETEFSGNEQNFFLYLDGDEVVNPLNNQVDVPGGVADHAITYDGAAHWLKAEMPALIADEDNEAAISYTHDGVIISTNNPEAIAVTEAGTYRFTITVTSHNYNDIVYNIDLIIDRAPASYDEDGVVKITVTGFDLTGETSPEEPQILNPITFDGKPHGYVANGEIAFELITANLPESDAGVTLSVQATVGGEPVEEIVDVGEYLVCYTITLVDGTFVNYETINVYFDIEIAPKEVTEYEYEDDLQTPLTGSIIGNVIVASFTDVNGDKVSVEKFSFVNSAGEELILTDEDTLPAAGEYTVTPLYDNYKFTTSRKLTIEEKHEHIDADPLDGYCDICGAAVAHNHVDTDPLDGKCDICGADYHPEHVDKDGDYKCDICDAILPHDHVDTDPLDGKCDICGADYHPEHVDKDGDYKCDICDAILPHTHVDTDPRDGKCDICGAAVAHTHVDVEPRDGKCDICGAAVAHAHVDLDPVDGKCDICGIPTDHNCVDNDGDGVCDSCEECIEHRDNDGDGKCDHCGADMGTTPEPPHDHVDANGDGKCDVCGEDMGTTPEPEPTDGGVDAADAVGGALIGVAGAAAAGTAVGAVLIVRKKRKNVI